MKKYLAFYGNKYYPNEAMGNFIGDFDNKQDAIDSIRKTSTEKDNASMDYNWGLVYDIEERKYIHKEGTFLNYFGDSNEARI